MMDWEKRKIIPCVIFHIIIFCNQVYGQENVMTHLQYRSNINHRYAVTWVTAHMKNPSDNPTEIFFKMTLPKTAFISGLIMEVKGHNYTSLVKEKEAARETYNIAKERGRHAGLVEQSESAEQKFQVSTNVEARGKVIFYLKYEELLLRNKGKYTQNIQIKPGVKPSKLDVAVHIMENEEIMGLEVISWPSDGRKDTDNNILSSSSNDTHVHMVNFNEAVVRYHSQGPDGLYGDLTLTYDVKRQKDAGEIQVSGDYFVHFFSPDGLPKMAAHTVFILDVSGSMAGVALTQLKEAMIKILSDFQPEDSFELLSFSDRVKTLGIYNASQPMDMKRATEKILKLTDDGMTNINEALIKGLENVLKRSQFSANQVVFLTDGDPTTGVTDLPTILRNVQETNTGNIPLYSLAFGNGPDFTFLSKLSYQNRGFARKIPVDSSSDELLRGFYQEIGTPLMADIDIQYPGDAVDKNSIVKKGWSTLQSGNEVVVAAKLNPGVNEVDSKIYGIIKTGSHQFKVPRLSKTTQHSEKENFIGRLWAYLTIQDLLSTADLTDDAHKVEELKARARSLSLKYNFVTKLTSLVVVRPEDLPLVDQETSENNETSSGELRQLDFDSTSASQTHKISHTILASNTMSSSSSSGSSGRSTIMQSSSSGSSGRSNIMKSSSSGSSWPLSGYRSVSSSNSNNRILSSRSGGSSSSGSSFRIVGGYDDSYDYNDYGNFAYDDYSYGHGMLSMRTTGGRNNNRGSYGSSIIQSRPTISRTSSSIKSGSSNGMWWPGSTNTQSQSSSISNSNTQSKSSSSSISNTQSQSSSISNSNTKTSGEHYIVDGVRGDDNNSGQNPSHAFKTIQRCVDELMLGNPGDQCWIRDGRYHEVVDINGLHGTKHKPFVIKGYEEEVPIWDGTVPIQPTAWDYDEVTGICSAEIEYDIFALLLHDDLLTTARWPNALWSNKTAFNKTSWRYCEGSSEDGKIVDKGYAGLADSGIDAKGAIAIINTGSFETYVRPVVNHESGSDTFTYNADFGNVNWATKHGQYYLEAALSLLDFPGEWFYDKDTKVLHLIPPNGVCPESNSDSLRGRIIDYALTITNTTGLTVANMTFLASTIHAYAINNTESHIDDLTFDSIYFKFPASSHRMLDNYTLPHSTTFWASAKMHHGNVRGRVSVINCTFEGSEGITLEHNGDGNLIHNNVFMWNDWAGYAKGDGGVVSGEGINEEYSQNTLWYNGQPAGLRPGLTATIKYNHVVGQCSQGRQIDGSGIHMENGSTEGVNVTHNWIHDSPGFAIRFDSAGEKMESNGYLGFNVVWKTSGMMVEGDSHTVENNVAFDRQTSGCDLCVIKVIRNDFTIENNHTIVINNGASQADGGYNAYDGIRWPIAGEIVDNNYFNEDVKDHMVEPDNWDYRPVAGGPFTEEEVIIGPYEEASSFYWIPGRMKYKSSMPIPVSGSNVDSSRDVVMFLQGYKAEKHHFYLGEDQSTVESAGLDDDQFQFIRIIRNVDDGNIFHLPSLKPHSQYFWRVDAECYGHVYKGDIWNFYT